MLVNNTNTDYIIILFFPPLPHRLLDVGALLIYHAIESVMEN